MSRIMKLATLTALVLSLFACKSEETKTVEWYLKPENETALEAKLAECKNNPGELRNTPNCANASMAFEKMLLGGTFKKVKEPAIPKF